MKCFAVPQARCQLSVAAERILQCQCDQHVLQKRPRAAVTVLCCQCQDSVMLRSARSYAKSAVARSMASLHASTSRLIRCYAVALLYQAAVTRSSNCRIAIAHIQYGRDHTTGMAHKLL